MIRYGSSRMGEGVRPLSQNPFGFLSLTYGREKEDKPKIWDFGFWDSLFGFREGSIVRRTIYRSYLVGQALEQ